MQICSLFNNLDFNKYWQTQNQQQSTGRYVTQTHYPDSIFILTPFKLRAKKRSSKCHILSLWFDPTGAQIHHLPHSKGSTLTITPLMRFKMVYVFTCKMLHKLTIPVILLQFSSSIDFTLSYNKSSTDTVSSLISFWLLLIKIIILS